MHANRNTISTIEREVTPEKLKAYFGDMVKG